MPAKSCDFEGKPERASQQGDDVRAARITCRTEHMRLLLLFPKNLTPLRALRFLGTLFLSAIFKGTHSNESRTFTLSVSQGIGK